MSKTYKHNFEIDFHGQSLFDVLGNPPTIKKIFVIYSALNRVSQERQNIVVVKWSDGTETRATCDSTDNFDPEVGVGVCVRKKFLPEKKLRYLLQKKTTVVQG